MDDEIKNTINKFINESLDYSRIILVTFLTGIVIIALSMILAIKVFGNIRIETINLFATSFLSASVAILSWTQLRKTS